MNSTFLLFCSGYAGLGSPSR